MTKIIPITSNAMFKELCGKEENKDAYIPFGKEQFKKMKKHIQINLNNYNGPKNRSLQILKLKDIEMNEILDKVMMKN